MLMDAWTDMDMSHESDMLNFSDTARIRTRWCELMLILPLAKMRHAGVYIEHRITHGPWRHIHMRYCMAPDTGRPKSFGVAAINPPPQARPSPRASEDGRSPHSSDTPRRTAQPAHRPPSPRRATRSGTHIAQPSPGWAFWSGGAVSVDGCWFQQPLRSPHLVSPRVHRWSCPLHRSVGRGSRSARQRTWMFFLQPRRVAREHKLSWWLQYERG